MKQTSSTVRIRPFLRKVWTLEMNKLYKNLTLVCIFPNIAKIRLKKSMLATQDQLLIAQIRNLN